MGPTVKSLTTWKWETTNLIKHQRLLQKLIVHLRRLGLNTRVKQVQLQKVYLYLLLAFNLSQHQGLFLCRLSHKVAKKTWSFSFSITPSNESVQFSRSAVSDSLWPHGLQHVRLPCPSPTLGVYSNSCPLSQWCYPTISFSVIPFSSCLQSLPVSGFFQWVSSLHQVAKALEFQLQHQSFQWTLRTDLEDGLVGSPCSPRDSLKSLLQHHSSKASILWCSKWVACPHPVQGVRETQSHQGSEKSEKNK